MKHRIIRRSLGLVSLDTVMETSVILMWRIRKKTRVTNTKVGIQNNKHQLSRSFSDNMSLAGKLVEPYRKNGLLYSIT